MGLNTIDRWNSLGSRDPGQCGGQVCSAGPETQSRGRGLRDLPAVGEGARGMRVGWNSLHRRKGRWRTLSLGPTEWELSGAPNVLNPFLAVQPSGSSLCVLLGPVAAWDFVTWQAVGDSPSFLDSISAQQGRCLQEPAPGAPSSLWVSRPGATV